MQTLYWVTVPQVFVCPLQTRMYDPTRVVWAASL